MHRKNKKSISLAVLIVVVTSICVIVQRNMSAVFSGTSSLMKNKTQSSVNVFVDPRLEAFMPACSVLQLDVKEKLKEMGMGEEWWRIHISDWVSEHVVRGVTTRLSYLKNGEEAGSSALQDEIDSGFPYVGEICKSLEIYEKNRDIFPTFKVYYSEIVKVFEELVKNNY